jgi:hypothetical protein
MSEMMQRILVYAFLCGLFALSTHIYFGSILTASADEDVNRVIVRDVFDEELGRHTFSGIVLVPTPCHDLTVRTHDFDADTLILVLESWEQPYRDCTQKDSAPRAFTASAFAPKNIEIKALFDASFIPVRVIYE